MVCNRVKCFNYRQDPLNITVVLTFGGHDYTSGFEKQLRGAIFETTKEYRYLNYIVHLIGDVLIVSGRISHGNTRSVYSKIKKIVTNIPNKPLNVAVQYKKNEKD